jgi:hypothetical protein
METNVKKLIIEINPVNAYHEFITTPELNETWEMLSTTASNAMRAITRVYSTKDEIIASQQALLTMLKLGMI